MSLGYFKNTLKKTDELAVESTGNTAFFVREVQNKVKRVRIVNPFQVKVISSSVKKTDEKDAFTIAKFLHKDLIPEVRQRTERDSQIASLIGTRDKFVKLRTALKNKIHNILNAQGIVTKREMFTSEKSFERVLALKIDSSCRFEIEIIATQIKSLNEAVDKISEELKNRAQSLPGHKNLTSIKGISDTGATIFLNTIGNINDFKDEKHLASYFGIVPPPLICFDANQSSGGKPNGSSRTDHKTWQQDRQNRACSVNPCRDSLQSLSQSFLRQD